MKYFFFIHRDTFTKLIKTGTSTSGPITPTKAWIEFMPNIAIATAIASSKLFDAAVKLSDTDCS